MLRLKSMAEVAQLPIRLFIGDELVEVPLFDLNDFIRWGTIVDGQRVEDMVKGATVFERVQLLSFYRVVPSDVTDLKQRVGSPTGTRYVITTCYKRARIVGHQKEGEVEPVMLQVPVPFDEQREVSTGRGDETRPMWPKIEALFQTNNLKDLREHAFDLTGIPKLKPAQSGGDKTDETDEEQGGEDPLS